MFLWRPPPATRIPGFAATARTLLASRLKGRGAELVLHLTEQVPPRLTLVPYGRRPVALLSAWGEVAALGRVREALAGLEGSLAGWQVDEAIPVTRERTWAVGERAPGACLLTLFHKNRKLDRDAFFHEWYQHHTPLSLRVHPLWCYVRNAVAEPIVPGSPSWDGIVCESFRERRDLLQHRRLFGGPAFDSWRALPNMVRVGRHVSSFLDMRTIENYLVEEYRLAG